MKRRYAHVEELLQSYEQKKLLIGQRLTDFASVAPEEYFYELAYCLLTPQSSAVNAGKAVDRLKKAGFPREGADVVEILRNSSSYIRFHNAKARNLTEAWSMFPLITAHLQDASTTEEKREWLVRNVRGLGWKEASHFLRNIGHRNLAILDRHILRNLKKHGALHPMPRSMTAQTYLAVERKFRRFAEEVGITIDELDLLFWSTETGHILK